MVEGCTLCQRYDHDPWAIESSEQILTLMLTAIRAIREAARTWGDVHERYLRAAVTFVDNFYGWVH